MSRHNPPTPRRGMVGLSMVLSLLIAGCGMALRKPSASGTRVSVESRDTLFVGLPEVPDTALASLEVLGWGGGRFQDELRKEIVFQFGRKKVFLMEDSASAKAWLSVNLSAFEVGREPAYQGEANLRTVKGEREIVLRADGSRGRGAKRSDPTVDYIRQIAETLVSEVYFNPSSAPKPETPPHMLMFY